MPFTSRCWITGEPCGISPGAPADVSVIRLKADPRGAVNVKVYDAAGKPINLRQWGDPSTADGMFVYLRLDGDNLPDIKTGGVYYVRVFSKSNDMNPNYALDMPALVSIRAVDLNAAETKQGKPANPGKFEISRSGSTTAPLTVSYVIAGSATNGGDYERIAASVVIPAGKTSVPVDIKPIDDTRVEGVENVFLTLANGPTYWVSATRTANVNITDNDPSLKNAPRSSASAMSTNVAPNTAKLSNLSTSNQVIVTLLSSGAPAAKTDTLSTGSQLAAPSSASGQSARRAPVSPPTMELWAVDELFAAWHA